MDKMRNRLYHFLRYFPNIDVIREQNYDKREIDICNNFGKIKKKLFIKLFFSFKKNINWETICYFFKNIYDEIY